MLGEYERSGMIETDGPCFMDREAAAAIVFWLLSQEGLNQALGEIRKRYGVRHAVRPDIADITNGVFGLPLD